MNLSQLGWNPYFTACFNALDRPDLIPARVSRRNKYDYILLTDSGPWTGILPGRLKGDASAVQPAVGDWAAVSPVPDEPKGLIHTVLPRRSAFSRMAAGETTDEQIVAANIDIIFVVTGLDRDYNPRRIERYLTQVWEGGARPFIVLNKIDLCPNATQRLAEIRSIAPGVDVAPVCAATGEGVDALRSLLTEGVTAAFVGSSGAGKSTLINRLLGSERLATGAVRPDDQRGRHTTTFRELFVLPGGGVVIDTPGMRELRLYTDGESMEQAFSDIEGPARQCRFRDCSHQEEPGCAVREALADGTLDPGRYRSYLKLQREVDYTIRRMDESYERNERARGRAFFRKHKEIFRNNPKR